MQLIQCKSTGNDEGGVTADGQHYTFGRDVAFSSPSGAAAVVYGGNISGPATWRREGDGLTYKDWRQQQLAQAQGGEE